MYIYAHQVMSHLVGLEVVLIGLLLLWLKALVWWESLSGNNMLEWKAVTIINTKQSKKENTAKTIIIAWAVTSFTSSAYSTEAKANTVTGNEYPHHATWNFLIAFVNNTGLDTLITNQKKKTQI